MHLSNVTSFGRVSSRRQSISEEHSRELRSHVEEFNVSIPVSVEFSLISSVNADKSFETEQPSEEI